MANVMTKYGLISGIEEEGGIHAFLGVPYAKPPLGELRFRPPVEPEPWIGVRECKKYGHPSLQLITDNHVTTAKTLKISSEDCLYLNIRTAAADAGAAMPVYVFIHGGAYETGGGNMRQYEGKAFAADGVVYVNINYRLGIFGALALDALRAESGVTGCLQILDAMMAVKWVHENIAAFGGDPENITIGGESAGAFTVSALMCMPEMKGMFKRCILESGSIRACTTSVGYGRGNPYEAVRKSCGVIADLGCDDTPEGIEKLRNLPAKELLYRWHFNAGGSPRGLSSNPVLDGLLFDGDLVPDPYVQKPLDVDLLFGFNTDEGSMFVDPRLTAGQYEGALKEMFPEHWREVAERYPVVSAHTPYMRLADICGLQKFKGSMLPYADVLSESGSRVYGYHFDYLTERLKDEGLGVRHIAELPFVFDCLLSVVGADDERGHETARLMHDFWVGFIKSGDPGNGWKRYSHEARGAMRFSVEGAVYGGISRIDEMLWLDGLL